MPSGALLERDLVVKLLVEGGAALPATCAPAGKRTGSPEIATAALLALARAVALFRVEHGELGVEPLEHDLGGVTLLPLLVLPFARLERTLEIDLGALLQILLGDSREILIEDDHTMPFGLLAALAGRLVTPALARRHA